MQAGWYDDGSGRQRWWDGTSWTDHYAPEATAPAEPIVPAAQPGFASPAQPGFVSPAQPHSPSASKRATPVLGFVGLGLSVLGLVLACIPVVTAVGLVVALAGFVVSLIGLFRKGAAKWPSIVGMGLAVVAGIIGAVVLVVSLVANVTDEVGPVAPNESTSQESGEAPTTGGTEGRLSPEELAVRVEETLHAGGITNYDDMPEYFPCVGQFLYDSELSDETLRLITSGEDPLEAERELADQVITDSILTCDPEGEGAWG